MTNNTKVINFIAGPGAGKTLMAALVFGKMKLLGEKVEYIQEYAKKLVWLNDMFRFNDQYYVNIKQFELLKSVVGHVDYIVTDSSLLLGMYYNRYYIHNISNVDKTEHIIFDCYKQFNNINIYLKRNKKAEYETIGRVQNYEEALAADRGSLRILGEYDIQYKTFESSEKEVNNIVNYILGDESE